MKEIKTPNLDSWKRNFKSISNGAKKVASIALGSMAPGISTTISSSKDVVRDSQTFITKTKTQVATQMKTIEKSISGRKASEILKGAYEDIQNGNFSIGKLTESSYDDMDDFDDIIKDNSYASSDDMDPSAFQMQESRKNVAILGKAVSSGNAAIIEGIGQSTNALANITIKAHTASTAKIANVALTGFNQLNVGITGINQRLESINQNIISMLDFQRDNVQVLNQQTIEYQGKTAEMMSTIGEGISEMRDFIKSSKEINKIKEPKEDPFDFSFGFDLSQYVQMLKKNFKNSEVGMMLGMGSMLMGSMGAMGESPIDMLISGAVDNLIPGAIKKTVEKLDKSFTQGMNNLLYRIGDSNGFLSDLLGKKREKFKIPMMGEFKKGAMSWNGEAQRYLTEVIPSHLSRIEAALTGQEQRIYDIDKGQFKSYSSVEKDFTKKIDNTIEFGMYDFIEKFNDITKNADITADEKNDIQGRINDIVFQAVTNNRKLGGKDRKRAAEEIGSALKGKVTDGEIRDLIMEAMDSFDNTVKNLNQFTQNMNGASRHLFNEENREIEYLFKKGNIFAGNKFSSSGIALDDIEDDLLRDQMEKEFDAKSLDNQQEKYDKFMSKFLGGNFREKSLYKRVLKNFDPSNKNKKPKDNIVNKFSNRMYDVLSGFDLSYDNVNRILSMSDYDPDPTPISPSPAYGNVGLNPIFKSNSGAGFVTNNYYGGVNSVVPEPLTSSHVNTANNIILPEIIGRNNSRSINDTFSSRINKSIDDLPNRDIENALNSTESSRNRNANETQRIMDDLRDSSPSTQAEVIAEDENSLKSLVLSLNDNVLAPFTGKLFSKKDGYFSSEASRQRWKDMKNTLFDEDNGKFKNVTRWFKDKKDYVKYLYNGKGYTNRKGETFEDNDNNTKDKLGKIYQKGYEGTMTYLFGEDYKNSENYKKYGKYIDLEARKAEKAKMAGQTTKESSHSNPNRTASDVIMEGATQAADNIAENAQKMSEAVIGDPNSINQDEIQKQTSKGFLDKVKKWLPVGLAAGAIGLGVGGLVSLSGGPGLIGSLFLPKGLFNTAIVGIAGSLLFKSSKFQEFLFGKEEDGKKTNGLISNKTQEFFKKHAPILIGGSVLGALKGAFFGNSGGFLLNTLFPGGPIGGAIMGLGLSMLKNNDRFNEILFGKKSSEDAKNKALFSAHSGLGKAFSKSSGFIKGGFKGAAKGAVSASVIGKMGFLGSAMTLGGPIGGAILGLGIGIASQTKKVQEMLFGTEEFDEDGNSKGRHKDGLIHRLRNTLVMNVLEPIKGAIDEKVEDFAFWAKDKLWYPFRQAFGPLLSHFAHIKKDISDAIHDCFNNIAESVGKALKIGFDKFFKPLTSVVGKMGKAMLNITSNAVKLSLFPVTGSLAIMKHLTRKLRKRDKREERFSMLKHAGDIYHSIKSKTQEAWANDSGDYRPGMIGKVDKFLTRGRNLFLDTRDAVNAGKAGYRDTMKDYGYNRLGYMNIPDEKKRDKKLRKQFAHDRKKWKEIDKVRNEIANENGHRELYLSSTGLTEMRKRLEKAGLYKGLINNNDDLNKLLYNKTDFINELKKNDKQKSTLDPKTDLFYQDTREYHDYVKTRFEDIYKIMQKEATAKSLDRKQNIDITELTEINKKLKEQGITWEEVGFDPSKLVNINSISDEDWDMYMGEDPRTMGDRFKSFIDDLVDGNAELGVDRRKREAREKKEQEEERRRQEFENSRPRSIFETFKESFFGRKNKDDDSSNETSEATINESTNSNQRIFESVESLMTHLFGEDYENNDNYKKYGKYIDLAAMGIRNLKQENTSSNDDSDRDESTNEAIINGIENLNRVNEANLRVNMSSQALNTGATESTIESVAGFDVDSSTYSLADDVNRQRRESAEGEAARTGHKSLQDEDEKEAKIEGTGEEKESSKVRKTVLSGAKDKVLGGISSIFDFFSGSLGNPLVKTILGGLGLSILFSKDAGAMVRGAAEHAVPFVHTLGGVVGDLMYKAADYIGVHAPELLATITSTAINNIANIAEASFHLLAEATKSLGTAAINQFKAFRDSYGAGDDESKIMTDRERLKSDVMRNTLHSIAGKKINQGFGKHVLWGGTKKIAKAGWTIAKHLPIVKWPVRGIDTIGKGIAKHAPEALGKTREAIINNKVPEKVVSKVKNVGEKFASSNTGSKLIKTAKDWLNKAGSMIKGIASKVKHLMPENKFVKAIEGMLKKITKGIASADKKTLSQIVTKMTEKSGSKGIKAVLGMTPLALAFAAYDGISGAMDAAYLFQIAEEDVTPGMRVISSVMSILLGTSVGVIIDIIFTIIHILFKDHDAKRWFANQLYSIFGDAEILEDAKNNLKKETEEYNKEYGTNLDVEQYSEMVNQDKTIWGKLKRGWTKLTNKDKYEEKYGFHEKFRSRVEENNKSASEVDYNLPNTELISHGSGSKHKSHVNNNNRFYGSGMNQADPRWANMPIGTFADGSVSTMATGGCGPTALAMVSESLGNKATPIGMANYAKKRGYIKDGGSTTGLFSEGANELGMHSSEISKGSLKSSLQSGNPVILSGKSKENGPYTEAGHVIVAKGLSNDGKVLVDDPMRGETKFSTGDLTSGMRHGWSYSNDDTSYGFGIAIGKKSEMSEYLRNNDMTEDVKAALEEKLGVTGIYATFKYHNKDYGVIKDGTNNRGIIQDRYIELPSELNKDWYKKLDKPPENYRSEWLVDQNLTDLMKIGTLHTTKEVRSRIKYGMSRSRETLNFAKKRFYTGLKVADIASMALVEPSLLSNPETFRFKTVYDFYVKDGKASDGRRTISDNDELKALMGGSKLVKSLGGTGSIGTLEYKYGFPFFQTDDYKWSDIPWGSSTVRFDGDDLSSLAMVATAFSPYILTPDYINNKWFNMKETSGWKENNRLNKDAVFTNGGFNAMKSTQIDGERLTVEKIGNDKQSILNKLHRKIPVVMSGYRYEGSPFGGVGDIENVNTGDEFSKGVLVARAGNKNEIVVVDPLTTLNQNGVFPSSSLDKKVGKGKNESIIESAYAVSGPNDEGIEGAVDFSTKQNNTSDYTSIEDAKGLEKISAIFSNFASIGSHFIDAVVSRDKYKSIYEISQDIDDGIDDLGIGEVETKTSSKSSGGGRSLDNNSVNPSNDPLVNQANGVDTSSEAEGLTNKNVKLLTDSDNAGFMTSDGTSIIDNNQTPFEDQTQANIGSGNRDLSFGKLLDDPNISASQKILSIVNASMTSKLGGNYSQAKKEYLSGLTNQNGNISDTSTNENQSFNEPSSATESGDFPTYSLTNAQLRGLANIVGHEQGSREGRYAEASLMANLVDKDGKSKTVQDLIDRATGGWFAYGKERFNNPGNPEKTALDAVRDVIMRGYRTLPRYVDEHDCFSDITSATNNGKPITINNRSQYQPNITRMKNRFGSLYTFYKFPDGVNGSSDPFGYTSEALRKKWGDNHYSVGSSGKKTNDQISHGFGPINVFYGPGKDWLNTVAKVKSALGNLKLGYSQTSKSKITVDGVTKYIRRDCSGFVSCCLSYYTGKDYLAGSSSYATQSNDYLLKAGFTPIKWPGWDKLKAGDIMAINGHVEIFVRNDGAVHKVYNCGWHDSANNPGITNSGHSYYTVIWRPNVAGTMTSANGLTNNSIQNINTSSTDGFDGTNQSSAFDPISNLFTELSSITKDIMSPNGTQISFGKGSAADWFTQTLGGSVTSGYGKRDSSLGNEYHRGIDISSEEGHDILSPIDGQLVSSGSDVAGYGNYAVIRDESGKNHLFGHMKSPVGYGLGSSIYKNDVIGQVGSTGKSTGSHLHYEIRRNGNKYSSINPLDYKYNDNVGKSLNVNSSNRDSFSKYDYNNAIGSGNRDVSTEVKDKLDLAINTDNIEDKMDTMIEALKIMAENSTKQVNKTDNVINNTTNNVSYGSGNTKSQPRKILSSKKDKSISNDTMTLAQIHKAIALRS